MNAGHVALALALLLTACGGRSESGRGEGELGFVPTTNVEEGKVLLPVTFPDATSAELVYPPGLEIAELGVFPYTSGTLHGKSSTPGRSDFVARDFVIRYGHLEKMLEVWNKGRSPRLLAQYEGVDAQAVGLWDLGWDDTAHKLGFQFGRWTVLVYDYVAAGAMSDAERATWAASFSGRETADGFLLLEASGPLRLVSTPAPSSPSPRPNPRASSSSTQASAARTAIRRCASTESSCSGTVVSPPGASPTPWAFTPKGAGTSSAH